MSCFSPSSKWTCQQFAGRGDHTDLVQLGGRTLTYLPLRPLPRVQQAGLAGPAPLPVVQAQAVEGGAGRGAQVEQGAAGEALDTLSSLGRRQGVP